MDMKKSALRKEFYREIRGSLQRFLSILLISALGVAFFAGLRACKTDMLLSADAFYDRTNMMDLRIVSSMGLTQDDVRAICAADGVRAAEGVFVQDALFSDGDEDVVVRLYSMTEQVNTCLLTGGRMPQGVSECAADEFFLSARGLKLGDTLQLESGSGDGLSDTLRKTQVTIVGSVSTGRYLSSARGSSTIGNGKVAGYLVLPAENIIPEYYTEIGVLFEGTRELNSYGDEYDAVVEQCMEALQAVRPERELARLQQLQQEAYRGLDEKESEIALQEQELRKAGQELKEAQQTIADGFSEAERGREKLAAERNGLPELFAGAEAELTAGRRALAEAWEKYNVQEAPVLAAREEYDSYVRQLSDISQGPEDIRKILEVLGIDETGIIEAEQELEDQSWRRRRPLFRKRKRSWRRRSCRRRRNSPPQNGSLPVRSRSCGGGRANCLRQSRNITAASKKIRIRSQKLTKQLRRAGRRLPPWKRRNGICLTAIPLNPASALRRTPTGWMPSAWYFRGFSFWWRRLSALRQ